MRRRRLCYVRGVEKLSIIVFSGDFDKLAAAFTLATGAAAMGREVNMFFTFWGLSAIKKKRRCAFLGGSWLSRAVGFMMGGLRAAPTSRFNLFGAGPAVFRRLMRRANVATPEDLLEAAKALGVALYACEMAACALGLKREDFIDEVRGVVGVATFLNVADGGQTLFI